MRLLIVPMIFLMIPFAFAGLAFNIAYLWVENQVDSSLKEWRKRQNEERNRGSQ